MSETKDIWDWSIRISLGTRFGGTFWRAGLCTLRMLKEAIETFGLMGGTSGYYDLAGKGTESHFIRGAGAKTWATALNKLEELGFDWHAHDMRYVGQQIELPTKKRSPLERLLVTLIHFLEQFVKD